MNFQQRALPLIAKGLPVIPLRPKMKIPIETNWPETATANIDKIAEWVVEFPDANIGVVARAELNGFFFLEADTPPAGIEPVLKRIEAETGHKLPETFMVRSRPGRGHVYFRQTPESIAMGNIAQGFVKHADFSVRVNREFVVGPGSIHPISGQPYEILKDVDIIPAPVWLIEWLIAQKIEKEKVTVRTPDSPKIQHGSINSHLVSFIGTLRNKNVPLEAAIVASLAWCVENCQPPIDEAKVERDVRGMFGRYSAGDPNPAAGVLIGGVLAGQQPTIATTPEEVEQLKATQEQKEAEKQRILLVEGEEITKSLGLENFAYPKFPLWTLTGTSLYENLVKPWCDLNSRHEEFMALPAITLYLNYLARRVEIKDKAIIPSIFLACVGKRGEIIKSSCVQTAMSYFEGLGMLAQDNPSLSNANGKQIVFEAASPEGLGWEMQRIKCQNAVLFYDEMSTLAAKMEIQASTLRSRLITIYESGKFQNLVKGKERFSIDPGSYCASLILCNPMQTFREKWALLNEDGSGMDDRFYILLQPLVCKAMTPHIFVDTKAGSSKTAEFIGKALNQRMYAIDNATPLQRMLDDGFSNRQENRAEKFSLYFAVDLGAESIDEECVERSIALVEYERAAKKFLRTFESRTREGGIQQLIISSLETHEGLMEYRTLEREMGALKYGTSLWAQSYSGLVKNGYIREEGTGKKNDPKMVRLLRKMEYTEQ